MSDWFFAVCNVVLPLDMIGRTVKLEAQSSAKSSEKQMRFRQRAHIKTTAHEDDLIFFPCTHLVGCMSTRGRILQVLDLPFASGLTYSSGQPKRLKFIISSPLPPPPTGGLHQDIVVAYWITTGVTCCISLYSWRENTEIGVCNDWIHFFFSIFLSD